MLIVVVALVVVALAVPLTGGTYAGLTSIRLRGTWLITVALAIQVAIISVVDIGSVTVGRFWHALTYGLVGVFLVANRRVRLLWLVACGWFTNTLAIAANGGVMPTSAAAAATLGRTAGSGFENSAPIESPRLALLGDIIATPPHMPLANVFSIGDIILVIGLVAVVVAGARPAARSDRAVEAGTLTREDVLPGHIGRAGGI